MNYARLGMMVTGMVFLLLAVAVLYYQTDLRNDVPEGVAIAVLLGITGLFVLGLSTEFNRARRVHDVDHVERHVEHVGTSRPPRPVYRYGQDEPRDVEHHERIEVLERRD